MEFLYEYKTHENERREGTISASSRAAVYAELKKRGIKPFRVVLAPGALNKLQSLGKRGLALALLVPLALAVVLLYFATRNEAEVLRDRAEAFTSHFDNATRRQVIGDSAIIEKGLRTGWSEVFPQEGERFLASFAVPGVPAGLRTTTEAEIAAALERRIEPTEADGIEARQIKAMVEGMKDELRAYRKAGGTIAEYGRRLVERQETECGYFNRTKGELKTLKNAGLSPEELQSLWEKRNAELRQMGIKLVPLPETAEK